MKCRVSRYPMARHSACHFPFGICLLLHVCGLRSQFRGVMGSLLAGACEKVISGCLLSESFSR